MEVNIKIQDISKGLRTDDHPRNKGIVTGLSGVELPNRCIRKCTEPGNKGAIVAKEYAETFWKSKDPVPMGNCLKDFMDEAMPQVYCTFCITGGTA